MKLKAYLTRKRLKDYEFAEQINRSAPTVTRLKNGNHLPDWHTMIEIIKATNYAVMPNDWIPAIGTKRHPHPDTQEAAA